MTNKYPTLILALLFCTTAYSQLQVDHPIQLTGSGANAKISGIQNVTNSQDATSVGALQSGSFIFSAATGTSNNFILNISPPINAYRQGMVFNFISNQKVTGPSTLNVNNLGAISITKNVNMQLAGCEIQDGQVVKVVYDGTNFQINSPISTSASPPTAANAGPDQLNVPPNGGITLAGNTPSSGTGMWSIMSGAGGDITNPSSPSSTFTGQASTAYILQWTISNSCGVSTDTVEISFSNSCYVGGSQTFNYSGNRQTFTVGCDVYSITIAANGAQGGTTTGQSGNGDYIGGYGAYVKGTFAVTPGQAINLLVGQAGGYGGCACSEGGGGGSWAVGPNNTLLLVAGGGGGAFECTYYGGCNGGPGQVLPNGAAGAGLPNGSAQAGDAGGTNGNGGNGDYGGGGGGWLTNGSTSNGVAGNAYPGVATTNGGGYGGGGGCYAGCCGDSGGGGGYSGGSSGSSDGCAGGGGGSYNNGTNPTNTAGGGANAQVSGNGVINITW